MPFIIDNPRNLKVLIGNNGSGKSSVLEALDTYFNNRDWTVHFEAKKSEAYVAPLFLAPKETIDKNLSAASIRLLVVISESFWNVLISSNANYKKYYESFFDLRNSIVGYKKTHYLYSFSKEFENNNVRFNPFDAHVTESIKESGEKSTPSILNKLRDEIQKRISYLYIPVETSLSDFLRLETKGMQDLMNVDIKHEISSSLTAKYISKGGEGIRTKKVNLLDIINDNLESFIQEIEATIQKIDKEYNFDKDYKSKVNLTANHVTDVIIEAYFSKRRLKKSKKSIVNLSAGERKRALIDIAYTFLSQKGKLEKEFILAIDEPESSLHISQCFEQFSKIDRIAEKFNNQILITTHWYGALPILNDGVLHHISNENDDPEISLFNLQNYFEDRGNHPNDIHLKSFFDLSSSILSSLKLHDTNWLLVEGIDDQIYLKYYLGDIKCKIIPLGGCTIVKTIYEYLFLPMSQKNENKSIAGKVFCLIDTDKDSNGIKLNSPSETKDKKLIIRRLQYISSSERIELKKLSDDYKSETEIEESLDPLQFYVALAIIVEKFGTKAVIDAFNSFEFDDTVFASFIKGDNSILNHLGNGRNIRNDKALLLKFIDDNKYNISIEYTSYSHDNVPEWINEIRTFFEN